MKSKLTIQQQIDLATIREVQTRVEETGTATQKMIRNDINILLAIIDSLEAK